MRRRKNQKKTCKKPKDFLKQMKEDADNSRKEHLKQMKEDADNLRKEQKDQSKQITDSINTLGARMGCLEAKVSNSANDTESLTKT